MAPVEESPAEQGLVLESPVEEAPVQERPAKKPKRAPPKSRRSKPEPAVDTRLLDPDGTLIVTFRARGASPIPKSVEAIAKEPATQPRKHSGKAPKETDSPRIERIELSDVELPILEWRPRPEVEKKPVEPVVPSPFEIQLTPQTEPSPVDSKERPKGRSHKRADAPAPEAPPKPEPTPVVVKKPPIAIPENAPQVVVRDGVPALVRNHRVYPPIMFFGNPLDERKAETVFDEIRMAADAGVHLHSMLIEIVVDPSTVDHAAGLAGYLLAKTIATDPEAQVIFRLEIQAPRSWETRYPKAAYWDAQNNLSEPSVCDDEFWGVAAECLDLFVRKIRLLPQSESVLGLHLERGEWFLAAGHGFDTSPAAVDQFRRWARRRYLNDEVTLRASWFDGSVSFDTLTVPDYDPEGQAGERFIRSSRRQRRYVDYHLFLGDITVQRIGELAYTAKSAAEGMMLIGVSYGYTFEWSHPGSGHLALGKLLRTDEVDFIAGPPSHRKRQPGESAAFPAPIDSFALNGKLYFSEEDFKTTLSRGHEPDDWNPPLKTPQALESVHWRGAGVALAHASGVAWMDLWGNGWLRTHSVWERAARVKEALIARMRAPLADPEVAVFIDERALAYLVDSNAFEVLVQNVRESVLRAGVSAAFYLLSDLAHREKFPESKLYLFLNAWDIRPDLRAAIKSRLQRDDKVLFWLYSAGLFDAGRDSLERAREVTGIALKPQPFHSRAGTTILNRRHPLSEAFPDKSLVGGMNLEPSYFAIPEDGIVLGEYTQTGLPSFVVKQFKEDPNARWTSVFLGEPSVNPSLIRALAQMAGAHVWNFHEDVVHVRAPFCTVHCTGTGPRTITLPEKCSAYNLLTDDWAAIDSTNLRFVAIDGSTHVFLVGPRAEIEHLLQSSPDDVLRIADLPKRELNVRVDSSDFDVPIMKLDEWIEGGDSDEVADEWFLRPQALLEDDLGPAQAEESPEQVGKRRRRRRRGRGGGDGDRVDGEVITATTDVGYDRGDDEPFSMNVVFRKRE
jgi:hypothetical protein